MAVEDMRNKDVEVENVPITTYDSLEQETPLTKLPGVIRQFPDVLVVPDVTDADSLKLLCEEARDEQRLVIITVRAKEASEALLRPLLTKISPKTYAGAVTGVVAHRLVRKLCETCREAYPPPPQILQRLGISADKVSAFYRPPTQPRQEVCPDCGGIGYKGQIGLIELLTVNDAVRQQIVKDPKVDAVRNVARKAGLKVFEDEGLLLVVKGVTSVQELARVLKEPAPTAGAAT
jgi:type II secretory ATPase GspE/PulE/Tfp pilus assembly ATPase PilB-like protein